MWELQLVLSVFGFLCLMFLSVLVMILYEQNKSYKQFIFRVFNFIQAYQSFYRIDVKRQQKKFNRERKNIDKILVYSYFLVADRHKISLLNDIKSIFFSEKFILPIIKDVMFKEDKNSCEFKDIKKGEKENGKAE